MASPFRFKSGLREEAAPSLRRTWGEHLRRPALWVAASGLSFFLGALCDHLDSRCRAPSTAAKAPAVSTPAVSTCGIDMTLDERPARGSGCSVTREGWPSLGWTCVGTWRELTQLVPWSEGVVFKKVGENTPECVSRTDGRWSCQGRLEEIAGLVYVMGPGGPKNAALVRTDNDWTVHWYLP